MKHYLLKQQTYANTNVIIFGSYFIWWNHWWNVGAYAHCSS